MADSDWYEFALLARTPNDVLRAIGGDAGSEPIAEADLAQWVAEGEAPEWAVRDAAERLAALAAASPDGEWPDGVWRWAVSPESPQAICARTDAADATPKSLVDVHLAWVASRDGGNTIRHPLGSHVRAWHERPRPSVRETRPDRILPARLAMVAAGQYGYREQFLRARHADPEGARTLPGFGMPGIKGPTLPLELYTLGVKKSQSRGPAAPLAMRLWIESVLSVPLAMRTGEYPVVMKLSLRELLAAIYPGRRRPRPSEYWPRLMDAIEDLDSLRVPWEDPVTGHGGLMRVVGVSSIPRGPGALDDPIIMTVHLPPGAAAGPVVSPRLAEWGARSAAAYRALIGLAYRWHRPGITRKPVRKGGAWVQSTDPADYPVVSDEDAIELCYPESAIRNPRLLLLRSWTALEMLAGAGELRVVVEGGGKKILPPS